MAQYKLAVGNAEIIALSDAVLAFEVSSTFPDVPAEAWAPYTGDDPLQANVGCYVIRSQGKTILVDTGIGPGPVALLGGMKGQLLAEMQAKGIRPEEVDIVAITHLHLDHTGWNVIQDGKPTFPRARYLVPQADWDYFTRPNVLKQNPSVQETVLPLERLELLEMFSGETAVAPEVTAIPTPGHTPGHTSFLVSSQSQGALIIGDLAHHPAQIEHPDWSPPFDMNRAQATETRRKVFDYLEANGVLGVFCHFPNPGFGRIVMLEGRQVFQTM